MRSSNRHSKLWAKAAVAAVERLRGSADGEVLDRLARLGQGLSPAQRNDFRGFKDAWDARMLQEHGDEWPKTFTGWMQRLLEDNENGVANAFSVFVHNETRRCFDGVPSLRVP